MGFVHRVVNPLTLGLRRTFGRQELRIQKFIPNEHTIGTVCFDGTQICISGKSVSADLENHKSIKPNTKNQTCVNIVMCTLMNGFWAHLTEPEPARTNDMTVLKKEQNVIAIKRCFTSHDIGLGDNHFHCFTVRGESYQGKILYCKFRILILL
jgi:hypothetical protein